jgi:hypothetical protein
MPPAISQTGFVGRGTGRAGIFDFHRDINPPIKTGVCPVKRESRYAWGEFMGSALV